MAGETLGARLKRAMLDADVSNAQLAAAADVHPVTVSGWRNDKQPPGESVLAAISKRLGVSAAWLRYGDAGELQKPRGVSETPVNAYAAGFDPVSYAAGEFGAIERVAGELVMIARSARTRLTPVAPQPSTPRRQKR